MEVYKVRSECQSASQFDVSGLKPEDRRFCLGSMLWFLVHLHRRGKPVLRKDIMRIVALADDADGTGGERS